LPGLFIVWLGFGGRGTRLGCMRKTFCLSLTASWLLVGCGECCNKSGEGTNSAAGGGNPLNAPADYVGALGKAQQSAVKTVDTTSLNQAIQLFNVENGRNPKDLNELVEKKSIPKIPDAPRGMKLDYDATAGKVRIVPK